MQVLFVCLGNICRSPMAEGVFRRLAHDPAEGPRIETDSAGTAGYHVGHAPDPRAQAAALRRGVNISGLRARRLSRADFDHFDYIIGMDAMNLADLRAMRRPGGRARIGLLLDYAPHMGESEVPDPYHGEAADFDHALDLIEAGAQGLLAHIRNN